MGRVQGPTAENRFGFNGKSKVPRKDRTINEIFRLFNRIRDSIS